MKSCAICPHQNDCLKVGACLDDLNSHWIAQRKFPRLMTPSQANAAMAALRKGTAVRRFTNCGKPPIVTRTKFNKHCAAYPGYGAEAQRLAKENEAEATRIRTTVTFKRAQKRWSEVSQAAERCSNGHAWTPENTIYTVRENWLKNGNRTARICKECRKASLARRMPSVERMRRVFEAMHHGQTLTGVTGRGPTSKGRLIIFRVLKNFMNANPKIGKRMHALSRKNARASARQSAQELRTVGSSELLRNNGHDAYEAIRRATAHLPEEDRGDVMSAMYVAVGEGRMKLSEAARRAPEFVKAHRYHPRVLGDKKYRLDDPLYEDSNLTWLDTITDADRLWG